MIWKPHQELLNVPLNPIEGTRDHDATGQKNTRLLYWLFLKKIIFFLIYFNKDETKQNTAS